MNVTINVQGLVLWVGLCLAVPAGASENWPRVDLVERQPLLAQVERLREALEQIGSPLPDDVKAKLLALRQLGDDRQVSSRVQELLDPLCLAAVRLQHAQAPVVVSRGGQLELVQQGWRAYLIKVINAPQVAVRLRVNSPQGQTVAGSPQREVASRWLGLSLFEGRPLTPRLSGLELEYRIIEVFSRDEGERSALIEFSATSLNADAGKDDRIPTIADWRFDKDTAGWTAGNGAELKVRDGSLWVESSREGSFFKASVLTPTQRGPYILRLWARSDEKGTAWIRWWKHNRPQHGADSFKLNLDQGSERLYEVVFFGDGDLAGLRIEPDGQLRKLKIAWIELGYFVPWSDWAGVTFPFHAVPSTEVTFRVLDAADRPAMGCFEISDEQGRVYPPLTKRLAPDFFFHAQIYRTTGETIRLPAGHYTVKCSRGPESVPEVKKLTVTDRPTTLEYRVNRWIDPSRQGYWSGDHHIHAAGCLHYDNPTQGVAPADMLRHCMGEDLKVGCCLNWEPCFRFSEAVLLGQDRHPEQAAVPHSL